jgi:hypothetical protein
MNGMRHMMPLDTPLGSMLKTMAMMEKEGYVGTKGQRMLMLTTFEEEKFQDLTVPAMVRHCHN